MTLLAAVAGALVGAGVLLVVVGLRPRAEEDHGSHQRRPRITKTAGRRIAVAAGAALAAGAISRWPIAVIAVGGLVLVWRPLFGARHLAEAAIARTEAVASWTEMLRDTLAAAAGLEQAIVHTAPVSPTPIRGAALVLAAELNDTTTPLTEALRRFAAKVDDPTCDLVVASLILSADHQRGSLADVLSAIASAAREDAAMRQRVEAGRARTRTAVRVIAATTLGMAAGLALLARSYLEPYGTATGQLVLASVLGLFGMGLWWLARMSRPGLPGRFLTKRDAARSEVVASW